GLLVFALAQVVVALRWWLLLRAQRVPLPLWVAVRLHFLGLFFNNLMPSSVGGDFLRAWYVTKHTEKRFEAALSVFVDRAVGLSGILIMALVAYVSLMRGIDLDPIAYPLRENGTARGIGPQVVVYLCLSVLLVPALGLLNGSIRRFLAKHWAGKRDYLKSLVLKAKRVVLAYCRRPGVLLLALCLTLFLQSSTIVAFWVLGRSIGMEAHLQYYFVIFPAMWVVAALPVSIAGIGILEGGITVLFMSLAGATSEQATCLALCQRLIWILTSLPGAVIHLYGGHLPKSFSFDVHPPSRITL
ncbi:MAG: flippase-like domain-containing protein, partial [Planctomycetes bacterium]|nr:flippase-like domain-containing protein [Planctomycetota bacterium]